MQGRLFKRASEETLGLLSCHLSQQLQGKTVQILIFNLLTRRYWNIWGTLYTYDIMSDQQIIDDLKVPKCSEKSIVQVM